jgi:hypothetical protein
MSDTFEAYVALRESTVNSFCAAWLSARRLNNYTEAEIKMFEAGAGRMFDIAYEIGKEAK